MHDNKRYIQQANENDSNINGNNENMNTKYCLRKKRSAITFSKKYFVSFFQTNLIGTDSFTFSDTIEMNELSEESKLKWSFDQRLDLLNKVCKKYSNPLRGESQGLLSHPIDEPR